MSRLVYLCFFYLMEVNLWILKEKYVQYITDNHSKEQMASKDGGVETRKFFLNCMCLLLGRFDGKKFESIVSEYGTQMSYVLLPQVVN